MCADSKIFRERYYYPEISVTDSGNGFPTLFNQSNEDYIIDHTPLIR